GGSVPSEESHSRPRRSDRSRSPSGRDGRDMRGSEEGISTPKGPPSRPDYVEVLTRSRWNPEWLHGLRIPSLIHADRTRGRKPPRYVMGGGDKRTCCSV